MARNSTLQQSTPERSAPTRPDTRAGEATGANKVPSVDAWFWLVKILTTGMGETLSDYLAKTVGPVPAVAGAGLLFTVAIAVQLRLRRCVPGVYWAVVVLVSVFGTMVADVAHVALGVPYAVSAGSLAVALAALFVLWHRVEGSLAIDRVTGLRRELFYWAAVLLTFALGTAVGDLSAATLDLGYLVAGLAFAALIAVPAVAARVGWVGPVAGFWWAYVLTRPLGASFADWAGVGSDRGGLGLGTGPVSLALAVVMLLALALSARAARADRTRRGRAGRPGN
ncbi:COG4705 family protein [Kitasatospora sp. NPDC001660]